MNKGLVRIEESLALVGRRVGIKRAKGLCPHPVPASDPNL